jgi:hypothetical protein
MYLNLSLLQNYLVKMLFHVRKYNTRDKLTFFILNLVL